MIRDESVRKLFSGYEKAFNLLDTGKMAEYFADTFISAGPKGTIAENKQEYVELSEKAAGFYRSMGLVSFRILSADESPVSNEYSLVKVRWGARFKATGDRVLEFDVSYLVRKTGPAPRIIAFITHQDEEQTMKEPGLPAAERT